MRAWTPERVAAAAGAELLHRPGPTPASASHRPPAPSGRSAASGSPEAAPDASGPTSAAIDSRTVTAGQLFVGLRGERGDGGEYARQALAAGAWGVLVAPAHARRLVREPPAGASGTAGGTGTAGAVLAHPDPLAGLQSLARAWLAQLRGTGARVVAITGSTGKTSTKDILGELLAASLRTVASPANFNTEIGLPLAILAAPPDTEALVLEMAMRGGGQIAQLTEIAEPEVGVIVNVGPVHLELLGSLQSIAAAKAELIAGLAPGATAVVPAGEALLEPHLRADVHTVRFGAGGDIELARRGRDEVEIVERSSGERIVLRPSFAQAHNLENLLAAVAAARALGVTPAGEVNVRFSALRGERLRLPGGIVLIDDCYNANPMSMRAAIDELVGTAPARRVAVLGDMLELGPRELEFHREIGAYASQRGVEVLVAVGPLAAEMAHTFTGELACVPDAASAAQKLAQLLAEGDTVLVKGSRGVGLERVAQALARAPAAAQGRR